LEWVLVPNVTSQIKAVTYGNGAFVGVGTDIVRLDIASPEPEFPISPPSAYGAEGSFVAFQAGVSCLDPPVRFQWKHDGLDIPGATNTYLPLQGVTTNHAGNYTVVASNPGGRMATSIIATLTVPITVPVPQPPVIGAPVGDVTNRVALGRDAALSVYVIAWPPPSYQWSFNGAEIPGATNYVLPIFNVSENEAGDYRLTAKNELGTATSGVLTLELYPAQPYFSFQTSRTAVEGSRVEFPYYDFDGGGAPPASYQVLKDGVNLALPISWTFILKEVTRSGAGQYALIASNAVGSVTGAVVSLNVLPGGPFDHWTQRNPLPQNDTLLDVSYGNGRFVAVGQHGSIVSSANGTDWLLHRLRAEVALSGVTFGNGLFVAVGERNILTSPDAATWTTRLTRGALSLQSAVFGNGRFVVAGGDTVLSSSDGLNWAEAALVPTAAREFRDIAFGNGRFVAVSVAGSAGPPMIWTSANAVQWAPLTGGPTAELESLTFANGQFVAVGVEGAILTSPDGLSWTSRNSGVSSRLLGVAFGNGRYIVVGTRGRLLSSANGATWTRENSGTADRLESISFASGMFVVVGENGTTLSSVNGSAWVKRSQGSTRDLDGLIVGGGLLAVAGKGGTILTSSDGTDFTEQSTGLTNDLHGIGWSDGQYVAVGEPGTILTSSNAVQWARQLSTSSSALKSVARGNGRWVAVGTEGEILISPDGIGWTHGAVPTWNDLNGVAYGNGIFVVVGDNLPPNGTLLTSPDGLTWTRRTQYIGKNLRSVTFVNNQFFATANDGVVLVSADGLQWEKRFVYGTYVENLRAATYAAGVWMLTGNAGFLFTSTNGVDWVQHSVPTFENLHGVAYFGGRFVTIGNRGTVLQSEAVQWPAELAGAPGVGGFQLTVRGGVGGTYRVQAAERLSAPEWTTIRTFTLLQPTTNFADTTAGLFNRRFYRAVSP